jgi:hypothetical protein
MALLKCPDCNGNVSDRAKACPNCGRPNDFGEVCPDCGNKREKKDIYRPQTSEEKLARPTFLYGRDKKDIIGTALYCPKCYANSEEGKQALSLFGIPRPKCPACGIGELRAMDAGARGSAFGSGNLLGAFTKSHRCSCCGYLA